MKKFIYNLSRYKQSLRTKSFLFLFKEKYKKFLSKFKYAFEGGVGLEIGGPSYFFSSDIFPVYEWAKEVDGVNFSDNTIWEGAITSNRYAYSKNKTGRQFILDGVNLGDIKSESYDFVLSSHNLEHIANPLKGLKEWFRVLKPGGYILLILPDKRFTFDHKRPDTSFSHILSDYENEMGEDDLTHIEEIMKLHDLKLDPPAGKDPVAFKKRCENNFKVRGMHHHIFSMQLLHEIALHFGAKNIFEYHVPPFHKIFMLKKTSDTLRG